MKTKLSDKPLSYNDYLKICELLDLKTYELTSELNNVYRLAARAKVPYKKIKPLFDKGNDEITEFENLKKKLKFAAKMSYGPKISSGIKRFWESEKDMF